MKLITRCLFGCILSVGMISIGSAQSAGSYAAANDHFAFDVYSRLSLGTGNIFFSPFSLSSALGMTYEGARSQTAVDMRTVLHISSDDTSRRTEVSDLLQRMNSINKAYELNTVNALWTQKEYPFKKDYLKLVKNNYFGEARNLDFLADPETSRVTINKWVSENTKDRINDLLPTGSITTDTALVLTNAVYFKDLWALAFDKKNTDSEGFWISPNNSVDVPMMRLTGKSFKYLFNDQAELLEIPYKGEDLSMFIILPRTLDIQNLEKILTLDVFNTWKSAMSLEKVDIIIPKFKFDSSYQMKDVLSQIGMGIAFDKGRADFSGMAHLRTDDHLWIDEVFHKAWIDTNEEGTEAAAATAVVMVAKSAAMNPIEPKLFRADHPFIFIIQENKTGQILFMGRVSDPREK